MDFHAEELTHQQSRLYVYGLDDFCGHAGASELAERIRAYWAKRGHTVEIKLKNAGFHPTTRAARYEIESSLVNGLPEALLRGRVQQ